jgi:predicted ATPase/class 3 adenylate cyclase
MTIAHLPSGTVTLMFTDIQGSTRLWETAPTSMARALARHDLMLRRAIEEAGGYVFKTVGDAFCAAFHQPLDGLLAAQRIQLEVGAEQWPEDLGPIRIRIGLHAGECEERDGDYFGSTVNRTARLEATAHGGQVVLSRITMQLIGEDLPDTLTLRDLGTHRLKDLSHPEQVYQLMAVGLETEFPPLRSLDNPELSNNLPEQTTSYVERATEQREIHDLVTDSRLVTLLGAGGSGKSRLALAVAADFVDGRGDGVWLVELAPQGDAATVQRAFAQAVSVAEEPSRPLLDTLVERLRSLNLLLVVDNCEHVIDQARDVISAVLQQCPQVSVLATSQQPLQLAGEQVYRVPSLAVPQAGRTYRANELAALTSVQLFVDRAKQQQPRFELTDANASAVASICHRLDGIPFALELAAARAAALAVEEIDRRLDDRFRLLTSGTRGALPRQKTLRAMIDWSFELLTEPERTLLCRLSIFAGGFDLGAAEVIGPDGVLEGWEVLDHLSSLVDKSLVQADFTRADTRYWLLETVRHYAAEHVASSGQAAEGELAATHARHYLAQTESVAERFEGPDQAEAFGAVDLDYDNIWLALVHFGADPAGSPEAVRLAVALRHYWRVRGYFNQSIEVLDKALRGLYGGTEDQVMAAGQITLGYFLSRRGDLGAAAEHLRHGIAVARNVDAPEVLTDGLSHLGLVLRRLGRRDDALAASNESVTEARATGNVHLIAFALDTRASLVSDGDAEAARRDYLEALAAYRQAGDQVRTSVTLNNLAVLELDQGNIEAAESSFAEALGITEASEDQATSSYLRYGLGICAILRADLVGAQEPLHHALTDAHARNDHTLLSYAVLGAALSTDTESDPEMAARLDGAASGLFEARGEILEPLESGLRQALRGRLEAALSADSLARVTTEGRALSMAEAVELALEATRTEPSDHPVVQPAEATAPDDGGPNS